jgi:hypothetical protein
VIHNNPVVSLYASHTTENPNSDDVVVKILLRNLKHISRKLQIRIYDQIYTIVCYHSSPFATETRAHCLACLLRQPDAIIKRTWLWGDSAQANLESGSRMNGVFLKGKYEAVFVFVSLVLCICKSAMSVLFFVVISQFKALQTDRNQAACQQVT